MIFKYFILSLFILSCSSTKERYSKKHTKKRVFSKETELSFEMIERKKALEYYRFLREQKAKKQAQRPKRVKPQNKRKRPKTIQKKVRKIRYSRVNQEEQEQELLQKMSYFCMQNRKQLRFNESKGGMNCSHYTETILNQCKDKYPFGTFRLTTCMRSKLR